MSNITTTHASSGLVRSRLVARERVSEHVVRVTLEEKIFLAFVDWGSTSGSDSFSPSRTTPSSTACRIGSTSRGTSSTS